MDDLISRQAAIKFIFEMPNKADEEGYIWVIQKEVIKGIDALPSAQPDGRKESKDESGI